MSANTEKASAGRHLLIYAALVAVVAGYTVLIWTERQEIEGYRYPTGLGDGEVYDLEANPLDPEKPMATLEGVGYFAAAKPEGWRDRYMARCRLDDAGQYYFYQPSEEIGALIENREAAYYLKLGSNNYIKVEPANQ